MSKWWILVMLAVGLGLLLFVVPGEEVVVDETPVIRNGVQESSCVASGGTWNACGSYCRGQDVEVCVQLCAEYCECESDAQCPSGFTCSEYIDGVGVCL